MPERAGKVDDDFDASQRLVHTDPTLKILATSLLACEGHYAGELTRNDPTALEWAAWDAYWALGGAVENGRDGVLDRLVDSGFIDPDQPPSCLEAHIDAVMAAVK